MTVSTTIATMGTKDNYASPVDHIICRHCGHPITPTAYPNGTTAWTHIHTKQVQCQPTTDDHGR